MSIDASDESQNNVVEMNGLSLVDVTIDREAVRGWLSPVLVRRNICTPKGLVVCENTLQVRGNTI